MAFIIPNATNTGSGTSYDTLDQAEPDSVDFEVLGNIGNSGVVSGCEVTNSNSTTMAVAIGVVVINGAVYASPAATLSSFTAPTDKRFDLVVARLSSGAITITVLEGNDSSTNPQFPTSSSATSTTSANNFDPTTDVLLAAVFNENGQTFTSANVVDKRVMLHSGVYAQGTAVPSSTEPAGSLYYKTNVAANDAGSGFYVRNGSSAWVEAAQKGTNNIANDQLRQSSATSVVGRSANSTGNVADITSTVDGQILRRTGGVLGFGTIDNTFISDWAEAVQDTSSSMITGATHSAINVTYNDANGTLAFAHADTSSASSNNNNSGATVIQDVTIDGYGHVTGLTSHSVTAANVGAIAKDANDSTTGTLTVGSASNYLKIKDTTDGSHTLTFATANLTTNQTVTFPNGSGTIALTSSSITGNAATATTADTAGSATTAGYATSAGNADTVDQYHASSFWKIHVNANAPSDTTALWIKP